MSIIKPLPAWALINRFPAFYDHESLTSVEQTARLYGKVNELIEAYNKYVAEINTELIEFESQHDKDINCFTKTIIRLTENYITSVDMKIDHMSRDLAEHYAAFTDNVIQTTKGIIAELKANGELDATLLDAVGDLNTRFTALTEEWEEKKSYLDAEVTNLANVYEIYNQEMQEKHEDYMEELRGVATEWRQTQGVVLAESQYVTGFEGAESLGNIGDYSIVGVKLDGALSTNTSEFYCICKVDYNTTTEQYRISGIGTGTDNPNMGCIVIAGVDMYTDLDGCLLANGSQCHAYRIWPSENMYMDTAILSATRIDGLVLNNNIQ